MSDNLKTEDVGDKYLENNYNIPAEFSKFDQKYLENKLKANTSNINDIIIFKRKSHKNPDQEWMLIKNPSNLDGYGSGVRGVIMDGGDFYLESDSETIHNDILEILYSKNIVKLMPKKNWGKKLPEETGFLTMQRYRDSNNICIGESNSLIYKEEDMEKLKPFYINFINSAKSKCPNLNILYKLVGVKFNPNNTGKNLMKNN